MRIGYDLIVRLYAFGLVVHCLVVAACGRLHFDPLDDGGDSTGDGGGALSCSGLQNICGPAGTSSCCGSTVVTGGSFYRSYDVGTDGAFPDMTAPASVSDFRLDTYEVTVGRFRQFVTAGLGTQANPPATDAGARTLNGLANQGGWNPAWNASLKASTAALITAVNCSSTYQSWTNAPGANESMPMNCIAWYEAFAFCAWDGGFLPTESEWNYAAAGGAEQRPYPWSSPPSDGTIDCSYANYYSTAGYCVGSPLLGSVDRVGNHSPAGDGAWGQADLAGNVYEWTLDGSQTYPVPCDDCAYLTPSSSRMFRGGDFNAASGSVRTGLRFGLTPSIRGYDTGVRCARAP